MHLISHLKTKAILILTLLAFSFSAFSQAPNLLNYQGVARNAVGNPLPNQSMKLRLSIHDSSPSGTVVYSEIRPITTNLGGLFSVQIGSAGATSTSGTIAGVNWLVGDKYLQVELDPASNNNYLDIGTVQLVSVPYAFAAGTAATVKTNANLTGVVTSVGNATSIANGAITSDMIGTLNKSKVGLDLVNNTSDASKPISTLTQAALDLKANSTDVNNLSTALGNKLNKADSTLGYVTPTQLAAKTFDQTPITNAIAGKLAIADSTLRYVTPTQLAAKKFDTTSLSNRINAKANSSDVATLTTALGAKLNIADTARLLQKLDTASLSNRINAKANTTDVNTALALKAPLASPTFTGTVTTSAINTGAVSSTSVTASTYASAPKTLSYTGSTIDWDPTQGLNADIILTQNSSLSFTAAPPVGSYGTIVLTQDGIGSRTITLPTLASVTNKVLGSTSTTTVALSTAANAKDIVNFYYDGTNCYWNIGQGYGTAAIASSSTANLATGVTGTLPVANGGTGATTATAALTNLGAAPIASPTFTGTVTAPIYASTPQALTAGATITWNPAQGLNASVTLDQNSTLSFSSTPIAGAYGTLVVTQDGIGNRTITLPSTTNKVLGSTSTTTIALSTAASAKDILNFYYDGTNCFWNIGQGYGIAASSSSTTNLATSVTGTLPVANGGTGATTLTGLAKGNGTGAMTAAVAGTDYQAPLTLTTTGTGAATLSGTTLNIPTPASGSSSAAVFLPTIVIGTQQWARLNLDVVTYRNGDIIPQVTDEATWISLKTGAWCYYNNDPANAKYGKLYNWYAVNDSRGLAPTGWHIPTDAEWGILIDKLNSYPGVLTNKLKAVGADWQSNTDATNESGFTGLPGGTRSIGGFNRLGQIGMWWSSVTCAYAYMEYTSSNLSRSGSNSEFGISVRCIRD
jgi:uncharacterized protein (TIGR02145 family)